MNILVVATEYKEEFDILVTELFRQMHALETFTEMQIVSATVLQEEQVSCSPLLGTLKADLNWVEMGPSKRIGINYFNIILCLDSMSYSFYRNRNISDGSIEAEDNGYLVSRFLIDREIDDLSKQVENYVYSTIVPQYQEIFENQQFDSKEIIKFARKYVYPETFNETLDPDFCDAIMVMRKHKIHTIVPDLLDEELSKYNHDNLDVYSTLAHFNQYKLNYLTEAAKEIHKTFSQKEIPLIARKGIVLANEYYESPHHRYFSDLDFYIQKSSISEIVGEMHALGYKQGNYNRITNQIDAHSRSEVIRYKLSPDHVLRFIKLTNDPAVKYVEVDFSLNPTWHNSGLSLSTEMMLKQTKVCSKSGLPKLNKVWTFLDVLFHFYREGFIAGEIFKKDKFLLRKFIDIALVIKSLSDEDKQKITAILESINSCHVLAWTLANVRTVFQELDWDVDDSTVGPLQFAAPWGGSEGEKGLISIPPKQRLLLRDKHNLEKYAVKFQ